MKEIERYFYKLLVIVGKTLIFLQTFKQITTKNCFHDGIYKFFILLIIKYCQLYKIVCYFLNFLLNLFFLLEIALLVFVFFKRKRN